MQSISVRAQRATFAEPEAKSRATHKMLLTKLMPGAARAAARNNIIADNENVVFENTHTHTN